MYRNEYEKALEQVKTAVEFARDCSNISQYIASHIPVYVLLREGEKELARRICHWLDGQRYAHD